MILQPLIVAMMWSLYPLFIRKSGVHPITSWMIISIVAAIVSVAVAVRTKKHLLPHPKPMTLVILAAFLGPALGALLYINAVSTSKHVSTAMALAFTAPVFTAILAYLLYRERMIMSQYIGLLLVVIGVILVARKTKGQESFIA